MKTMLAWANRHAGKILLLGLAGLAWHNGRQWRRDRQRLDRRAALPPPPDPESWPEQPLVSLLVAAWNEAGMIEAHVRSFLALRYPHKELILCAGGDDGTYDLACRHAGPQVVVLEQQPGEGKQRALRRCFERSQGEIVFLTDADCLLDDDSFGRTMAPLLDEGELVVTGASRPAGQQMAEPFVVYQWCTDLYTQARDARYTAGILGRNCALRREALDRIGGFDPEVRTGTDYHMAKRLLACGYRIRHVPDSRVETRYPATVRSYWRRQSRWVRNLLVHGPAFGAYDEVRMALQTGLVGSIMLLLPLIALLTGPVVLVFWLLLLAQSFLAKVRYARFAILGHRVPVSLRQILLTPAFIFVDFVAWSRPLLDLVLNRERW